MPLRRLTVAALLALPCALAATPASASDFRSLAEPAILYDAPSKQGKPLFVIQRYTPVEMVVSVDRWVKVREPAGSLLWLERRQLSEKRTLIVTAARAEIRQKPDGNAPLAFEAAKDLVLELADAPADGWVKVRHRDGSTGFIRMTQVWGL
ncbi:MAG TPA: SH3 domain-containing protein [Zoogloea sp.]|uniref:SH3 domain-containing protein n=1 Tax=Zoogloea sp. TaxID=49181 RepID=UPI002CBA476B|nr:SH3 domain-containing protein [Zoogloea sp.]HMV16544.1 SH3 domain-containing protein [Rhodocyclaceae bacterium]HMV64083.1 SH3 domain-containing protein [Rhodocyclaceae bacterium]HMW50602.1 SH3 domain-containing protein [Rhodocyclaceae bacterium]HMY48771.1 SH3 domain-containing protein [Rhodocyclaceae bacterium]HMZ74990.1 SH3 domain-containing protein [Rhodocyclaceae bacterium]